jgi:hypothetical protein
MDGIDIDDLMKLLREEFYKMETRPVEDIAYYQGVKNIDKYRKQSTIEIKDLVNQKAHTFFPKHCPYHVAAAITLNHLILEDKDLSDMTTVTEGTKAGIVFVCPTNMFKVKAIAYTGDWNPKLFEYFKLDVEYMFQRLILGPLEPAVRAAGHKFTMTDILGYKFVDSNNTQIQTSLF